MPLVVISGVDGSGKTTQVQLLKDALARQNLKFAEDYIDVKFPRYGQPSAKMVEMYLNGTFGSNPNDIPTYIASTFYAIDRGLSYINEVWGRLYNEGKIVIADRYYESNIIHQTAKQIKVDDSSRFIQEKILEVIDFTDKLEHGYFKLPEWDLLVFLTMNADHNWELLRHREGEKGDIHEVNRDYFDRCHAVIKNMIGLLPKVEFVQVCDFKGIVRDPYDISNEIFNLLYKHNIV